MRLTDTLWGIRRVWLRYFDVFLKSIWYYLVTTFMEPVLYLLAFGFGLGGLVGEFQAGGHAISYRSFVFAGIIGQTVLFQGFFEAAYGGFVRMYYQRIFHAMAVTPITLSEVLWGELIWDASKSTLAAMIVVLIGVAMGDFRYAALLTVLPLAFVGSFLFSALGLAVTGYSRTIDQISYPQYFIVFPMFLFCGVFFPVETLPLAAQWVAWVLPLTSVVSLARTFTLGFPFDWQAPLILAFWLVALVWIARRAMFRRLVK